MLGKKSNKVKIRKSYKVENIQHYKIGTRCIPVNVSC